MRRSLFLAAALASTATILAGPAAAQYPGSPATGQADALADAMRRVGADPRDLDALLTAAELSLRVGDVSGAASLFKRAEQVDPMNGRVKAGMARILVTQERPGEALRYFDQAIGYGLDPASFAGDRGLAYDLIGEQERAQRDYRLALKTIESDEVRRRYALSLGISGKQDQALEQIDTLLRRNDRGAWRARAFILAMNGDVAGANKITTTMMPGAVGQGLQPFLAMLPSLPATDRAFAVHFGEVRTTPQRIADARLTPALPPLGVDPEAPVALAAVAPTSTTKLQKPQRRRSRRDAIDRIVVASAAPRVIALPSPPSPGFGDTVSAVARGGAAPVQGSAAVADPQATVTTSPPPVRSAARTTLPGVPVPARSEAATLAPGGVQRLTLADTTRAARYLPRTPSPRRSSAEASRPASDVGATQTAPPAVLPGPGVGQPAADTPSSGSARTLEQAAPPAPVERAVMSSDAATGARVGDGVAAIAEPPPSAARTGLATSPAASAVTSDVPASQLVSVGSPPTRADSIAPASSQTPVAPTMSERSILAGIVSGISIPGYELGVGPAPSPPLPSRDEASAANTPQTPTQEPPDVVRTAGPEAAPKPVPQRANVATKVATSEPILETAPSKSVSRRSESEQDSKPSKRPSSATVAKSEKTASASAMAKNAPAHTTDDRKTAAARKATEGRRAAAAKEAAEKKALADREAAEEKKAARAEPARIWVQVAGGANEADLPKAWASARAKAPALGARQGYATPLRATNRVVTGPFKTDAEARAFVNQLAKQGVSAFPFTSSAGQKMTKLPSK